MKKFEIIDLIEELGFPYLATMLDENEFTMWDSFDHLHATKLECTAEEFSLDLHIELIYLVDYFFFNLPTNQK